MKKLKDKIFTLKNKLSLKFALSMKIVFYKKLCLL